MFLFHSEELLAALTERGVKIGVATSVRKADWEAARIFPPPQAPRLRYIGLPVPSALIGLP